MRRRPRTLRGSGAGCATVVAIAVTLALAILSLTVARLAGADGVLAAFAAGVGFNALSAHPDRLESENVEETMGNVVDLPIFFLFGVMLPWAEWSTAPWAYGVFAVAILIFRRPPAILLLWPVLGRVLDARDKRMLAWFAPMGVAAIYYGLDAAERMEEPAIWPAAAAAAAASILAHGATAYAGIRRYEVQEAG